MARPTMGQSGLTVVACSWDVQSQGQQAGLHQLLTTTAEHPVQLVAKEGSGSLSLTLRVQAKEAGSPGQGEVCLCSSARTVEASICEETDNIFTSSYSYLSTYRGKPEVASSQAGGQSPVQGTCFFTVIPVPAASRDCVLQLKLLSLHGDKKRCSLYRLTYGFTVEPPPQPAASEGATSGGSNTLAVQQRSQPEASDSSTSQQTKTNAGNSGMPRLSEAAASAEPVLSQAAQMRLLLKHALQPGDANALPASLQMLAAKVTGATKGGAGNPGGGLLASVASSVARSVLSRDEGQHVAVDAAGLPPADPRSLRSPLLEQASQGHGQTRADQAEAGWSPAQGGLLGQVGGLERVMRVMDRLESHMTRMDLMLGRLDGLEANMQHVLAGMSRVEQRLAALDSNNQGPVAAKALTDSPCPPEPPA